MKKDKFIVYEDGGDTQIYESTINGKISKTKNEFTFIGFSNSIHPYFRRQTDFVKKVLESAGIILNIENVTTVNDIGKNVDRGYFEIEDVYLPEKPEKSSDGNTYILIQDVEMGRGWAVLIKISSDGNGEILDQDHRDTIRDRLMEVDFIRQFGIDYSYEYVEDL